MDNALDVRQYGSAVRVVANGPDDRIDDERLAVAKRMLLFGAARTAAEHGLVWTDGPHVLECPPSLPLPPGAPQPRSVYEDYDEDGYGIGEPTSTVYEWQYGWTAYGYKTNGES
jgi:hypothetical protein